MRRDDPGSPLWKRLAWFVGLWIAGVAVVSAVGYLIKLAIGP